MQVVDWLLTVGAFVALMAWCALSMTALVALAGLVPLAGPPQAALLVVAGAAGLGLALWTTAKAFGFKRL